MADTVLGVTYKGGVVLATDQTNARSILTYQHNLDKIKELSSHSAMGVSGPNCDLVNFTEYIAKNIKLYELSHDGMKLSTHAQANFARSELAAALRKGPYQVNILLGGYDTKKEEASLYTLDYLGSLHKVDFGAQGYASYFCLSIMDRDFDENMTEKEAVAVVDHCIQEIQTRFLLSQPNFIIKVVDKDGVRVVRAGKDPADT
uniref:Proteasome subunit beta n=1 Tax=Cyclophora tenuis TaxID=216820 RepID=A0A7S1D702_CYCTE|mmetsp:Transcript_25414/g.43238  ORF Transcript_25414/g.43238 Transcript_25414/m.43238 type:complete len:203 (+) Transcript_25414:88-696(+)|eukprot:CAMPEP_0116575272 /NCGR_PEP_ID=MMETSP0397-20121206/19865_1 /TAXON_ID=216820 /ORGANISM="Cyclophora tenuis, Strain ECT3854" /LENGTH=202 /DNA_ID=CAMNT_0004104145 /DNA_START=42 /DNA_END=650 /DNA_ORIENTATION=+